MRKGDTPKDTVKWWGLVSLVRLSLYSNNRRTRRGGSSEPKKWKVSIRKEIDCLDTVIAT